MSKDDMILFWSGPFSNFYPTHFTLQDASWYTTEQYFMWRKAIYFEDYKIADKIGNEKDPATCKWLGRHVEGFNIDSWSKVCKMIMFEGCFAKFTQNEWLKNKLLQTGNKILVEASPYDIIWGIGLGENDPGAYDESRWRGQNLLGKVLMNVRDNLDNKELLNVLH